MVLNIDLNLPAPQEIMQGIENGETVLPAIRTREEFEDDLTIISPRTFAFETNGRSSRRQRTGINEVPPVPQYFHSGLALTLAVRPPTLSDWGHTLTLGQPISNDSGKAIATQEITETQHPQLTSQLTCPICMSAFTEETATKCGHIFCKECIYVVLSVQKKCPTCRMKLRQKDTMRVYFSN